MVIEVTNNYYVSKVRFMIVSLILWHFNDSVYEQLLHVKILFHHCDNVF